ncbi:MAG: pilus assembly protein CpaF, partial [Rhodospirillales bacterium]|nr:pilus assembly protein CpaF [Rhodospirillales bacterium]
MIYKLHIEAFASTAVTRTALDEVARDRLLSRSTFAVSEGGIAAAIAHYSENPSPQLMIVEDTGEQAGLMERLASLAEVCEPGTRVILVGAVNDILTYRTLMSQGLSDYLVGPVTARDVMASIAAIFSDPSAPPRGKLWAFLPARGGTGSSTLAQNMAWSLSEAISDDVILIDLDLAFGTASLAFNIEAKQTVADVLSQPDRLDLQLMERYLVKHNDHLQVLAAPSELQTHYRIETEALYKVLDLARQMAPYVVLDLPHAWEPWSEAAAAMADELIVTALPDLPNLRDCKN